MQTLYQGQDDLLFLFSVRMTIHWFLFIMAGYKKGRREGALLFLYSC